MASTPTQHELATTRGVVEDHLHYLHETTADGETIRLDAEEMAATVGVSPAAVRRVLARFEDVQNITLERCDAGDEWLLHV